MPLILIPEDGTGVPNANTYATRAQADEYHEGRLHGSTWTAATPESKDQALVSATRYLDTLTWEGERISIDQALAWPRTGAVWDGHEVPDTMLPRPVRDATIELARLLLDSDLQAEQDSDNVKEIGLGQNAVNIVFKDGSKTRRMPLAIGELLQGLGGSTEGGITIRKISR